MQIRKRLFLSNVMMFALPFAVILVMAGALYLSYQEAKLGALGNTVHDKQAVHVMQDDMRQTVMNLPLSPDSWGEHWTELSQRMDAENYHLAVVDNRGNVLYSNLTEIEEWQIEEELKPVAFAEDSAVFVFRDSNIIKYMFSRDNRQYHLIGIRSFDISTGRGFLGGLYHSYVSGLLLAGLIVFVLINMWLAHRLAQQILQPIKSLRQAAKAVEQGDYSYHIEPIGDEEFASLCRHFNGMAVKLAELQAARQASDEERRTLIAGLSHDIRTPLTVIRGYVEGLKDGVAKDSAMESRYLNKIAEGTEQISRLLERLFLYSKLNMKAYPFNFRQLEFTSWLKSKAGEMRLLMPVGEGLCLVFSPLNLQAMVRMDTTEIQRLLTNLLENAVKYHPCPQELKVTLSVSLRGDDLLLKFTDNGVGVAAENLPRLFQEFFRTDTARSETRRGSGLGLAIGRRIVEAHGGRIWAEAGTQGTGLTICIVLPTVHRANGQEG